jgi:uncharacterized membrane protein
MKGKEGKISAVLFAFDAIGFLAIIIGSVLFRLGKDELTAILGTGVISIGILILSLTRYISKQ